MGNEVVVAQAGAIGERDRAPAQKQPRAFAAAAAECAGGSGARGEYGAVGQYDAAGQIGGRRCRRAAGSGIRIGKSRRGRAKHPISGASGP